jgi:ABC-type multidrug transport system ATPase subunit
MSDLTRIKESDLSRHLKLTEIGPEKPKNPNLIVKQLNKKYGDNHILKNISETFKAGKISCILGHNGAGKSTLIKILSGLLARSSGEISFQGVCDYTVNRKLRMKIGIVTTENLLEEQFTVYQQLKVVSYIKNIEGEYKERLKAWKKNKEKEISTEGLNTGLIDDSLIKNIKKNQSFEFIGLDQTTYNESDYDSRILEPRLKDNFLDKKINEYLQKFNLIDFKNKKIGELSEGIKKKLSIAMAFINRPMLLFLDEPTSIIDAISRKEIWEFIKEYKYFCFENK